MNDREWVEFLFRTILKRPADAEGLAYYVGVLGETGNLREVILSLIESEEYSRRDAGRGPSDLALSRHDPVARADISHFGAEPPLDIDIDIPAAKSDRLLHATAETWQALGTSEPHWSVLTAEQFRQDRLDEEAFYATGATDFDLLRAFFRRAHRDVARVRSVLELGCGVGRLTEHLAKHVARVDAVDISAAHLAVARDRAARSDLANVHFHRMSAATDIDGLAEVDLAYSVIVLQHNPPPVMKVMLEKMLRRVAPGGFAYFQLPTYRRNYTFSMASYLASPDQMEMHVLPQPVVFALLDRLGFRVLEVLEDGWVGNPAEYLSNTFFAERRGAGPGPLNPPG